VDFARAKLFFQFQIRNSRRDFFCKFYSRAIVWENRIVFLEKLFFRPHLAENEKIVFIAHRHFICILPQSVKFIVFGVLIPFFLGALLPPFFWVAVIWAVLVWLQFLAEIADWFFDVWLITNISVINIEWRGIFARNSSRIEFADIEEVAYEIKSLIGIILKFGDCFLRCAGTEVVLKNAANPKKIELKIQAARSEFLDSKKKNDSDQIHDALVNLLKDQLQS